uniref:Uncharacterized protein n=1 Tax=Siphoviridae sp. ctxMM9 TaxID=2827973 RepID=A0A8S5T6H8_9CAUD|nr:MAG TPA: hypothetical protein [Siphoviridae sp. ctxMM9]
MENYLLNVVESYRVETVEEALFLRDKFSEDPAYEITSFTYTTKYDKKNDEEYQLVKVKKEMTPEKNPQRVVKINYEY